VNARPAVLARSNQVWRPSNELRTIGAIVLLIPAACLMFIPGYEAISAAEPWTVFYEYLLVTLGLWVAGAILLAQVARSWPVPRSTGDAPAVKMFRVKAREILRSFPASAFLMITGLGVLAAGLLMTSPVTCALFIIAPEAPVCDVPSNIALTALALAILGSLLLALGLGIGVVLAARTRTRSVGAVCASITVATTLLLFGIFSIPPACTTDCAGPTPFGTVLSFSPGVAETNATGTHFVFPVESVDPNYTVQYNQITLSFQSSNGSPVTPGGSWSLQVNEYGNRTLAVFSFSSATWSAGASASARVGDTWVLTTLGANTTGDWLVLTPHFDDMSGTVNLEIPPS